MGRSTGKINEDKGRTEKVKSCHWQTTAILSWRCKKMVLNNTIVFLFALLVMFGVAQSLAQPTDSPDRGSVALDLSSSWGNLEGSAPKLSALCRRTLRDGASLAVNKAGSDDGSLKHDRSKAFTAQHPRSSSSSSKRCNLKHDRSKAFTSHGRMEEQSLQTHLRAGEMLFSFSSAVGFVEGTEEKDYRSGNGTSQRLIKS